MEIYRDVLRPVLQVMPQRMNSMAAVVMLLAIGKQESDFRHRQQIGGPARGFWQFEQTGGVNGVLQHPASAGYALALCRLRDVQPSAQAVHDAMLTNDILAAAFARLLLWTDPKALPAIDDAAGGWALYLRTWRPGKPHPDKWAANWKWARQQAGV